MTVESVSCLWPKPLIPTHPPGKWCSTTQCLRDLTVHSPSPQSIPEVVSERMELVLRAVDAGLTPIERAFSKLNAHRAASARAPSIRSSKPSVTSVTSSCQTKDRTSSKRQGMPHAQTETHQETTDIASSAPGVALWSGCDFSQLSFQLRDCPLNGV